MDRSARSRHRDGRNLRVGGPTPDRQQAFAPRRTIEPSIVQGLVSCRKCGYALSRTSTRTSARKIHYYRCLGADSWRHLGGSVCDSRPIRQDLLDEVVWREVMRLIEDPTLIRAELDRRLDARARVPVRGPLAAVSRPVRSSRRSLVLDWQHAGFKCNRQRPRSSIAKTKGAGGNTRMSCSTSSGISSGRDAWRTHSEMSSSVVTRLRPAQRQ
ncbi:zinc ribbon domain-containing protein [Mesorhizobium sp. M0482]|uniref:zinc ribbon domain-containing protein n=1 Tax=Mesorhizobium sp. M0482 TaxID=2956948 RepID=UPI00333C3F57